MSDSKSRNGLADLPEFSNLLELIEKQAKRTKTSDTPRDHGPEETELPGQNRLKSETETPSYYSYFNSETSSSVEFDSCSSNSDNSYINYDPRDVMIWETFDCEPCDTEEDLLDWLEHNKPSKINIKDGVGWICIRNYFSAMQTGDVTDNLEDLELTETDSDEASEYGDAKMAQKLWRECNEKTIENVVEIAQKCRLLIGKWMIFPSNKNTVVDGYWRKIAVGIFNKRFGDKVTTAKVSPHNEDKWSHVICIYTDNFCDQDQVLQLEDMLRRAGIFCPLFFKPDVFTHLGIYKGTYPNIQPTLYKSTYDTESRKGKVTTDPKYEDYLRLSWSRDI